MSVSGTYDFSVATPMGDQNGTLSVSPNAAGDRFMGSIAGALGAVPVEGAITGNTLTWTMKTQVPVPLEVNCTATVSGDSIEGTAKTAFFGSYPMTGRRAG